MQYNSRNLRGIVKNFYERKNIKIFRMFCKDSRKMNVLLQQLRVCIWCNICAFVSTSVCAKVLSTGIDFGYLPPILSTLLFGARSLNEFGGLPCLFMISEFWGPDFCASHTVMLQMNRIISFFLGFEYQNAVFKLYCIHFLTEAFLQSPKLIKINDQKMSLHGANLALYLQ